MESFAVAFEDSYYRDVIKVDEDRFLDCGALGDGILMRHMGKAVKILDGGDILIRN
jgi:hypothetical protein